MNGLILVQYKFLKHFMHMILVYIENIVLYKVTKINISF